MKLELWKSKDGCLGWSPLNGVLGIELLDMWREKEEEKKNQVRIIQGQDRGVEDPFKPPSLWKH